MSTQARRPAVRIATWFLVVSYGAGAPVAAWLEITRHVFSQRFHYPPALIYATCAVQFVCAIALLVRRHVPLAAAALSVTSAGAFVSHLRIGSPMTSIPALAYTAMQVWVGMEHRNAP